MKTETKIMKPFEWKNSCKIMEFYRRSLNMSKYRLAKSLGVTSNVVRWWEKGIKEPKISNFVNLMQVLGVSETEFLHPSEDVQEKVRRMSLEEA